MNGVYLGYFKHIKEYDELESTNEFSLKECQRGNLSEGTIITARHQTSGKGRYGNKWLSLPDKDLLVSFIMKPKCNIEDIYKITIPFSLSIYESLRPYISNQFKLYVKWPNDILIEEKKCAGILANFESKSQLLVIGLGVNVNSNLDTNDRISLSTLLNQDLSIKELLNDIIEGLNRNVDAILSGTIDSKQFNKNAAYINKEIQVLENGILITGTFKGINSNANATILMGNEIRTAHSGTSFRLKA